MRRDRSAWVAAGFLLLLGLAALLAPVLAPHDPDSGDFSNALASPSTEHWLGTDHLGRDVVSRLMFGARTSLVAGLEVVAVGLLIGVTTGVLAGFRQGWFDRLVMRFAEIAVSLPVLLVAIAVVAMAGPGVTTAMLAVGVVSAMNTARLTRAVVYANCAEDYVPAARVAGASEPRIIGWHLLPNIAPTLVVQATWLLAVGVLAEASVSYLGLGAVPPEPSWGVMLSQARETFESAPWLAVWPGLCIFLTVLAFNQLGDRVRDVLGRGEPLALDAPLIEQSTGRPSDALDGGRASNALELHGVSVTYARVSDGHLAVSDVSLSIARGEVVALVGESGAGKTTVGLAALGLVPSPGLARADSILVDGIEVVGMTPQKWRHVRGRRIGYVAQDPATAMNPTLTVGRQIAEPLRWHLGRSRRAARAEAAEWMSRVGIRPERYDEYPHQFSGGELQRLARAMALAPGPSVLVADEPTTALDTVAQARVLDLLLELREWLQLSVLLISHDLAVVAGVADRVAVMRSGRIVEQQPVEELFTRPTARYTRTLLDAARPVKRAAAVRAGTWDPARTPATRVLEIEQLHVSYPARKRRGGTDERLAVDGVDLSIAAGETFGLVGESGAGKTTIANVVVHLVKASSGRVTVADFDVTALGDHAPLGFRKEVQLVQQQTASSLNPARTIGAALAEPLALHFGREQVAPRTAALLESVSLPLSYAARRPHQLSTGERQRAVIARALAPEPRLVVLDEPVSGLDAITRERVVALLRRLQHERSIAYLLITHDIALAQLLCSRIAVIHRGRIVEEGEAARVCERPQDPFTKLLVSSVPRLDPVAGRAARANRHRLADSAGALNRSASCRSST